MSPASPCLSPVAALPATAAFMEPVRRRRCVLLADGSAVCSASDGHASLVLALERSGAAFSLVGPGGALSRHLTPSARASQRALVAAAVALRNRFAWLSGVRPFLHVALLDAASLRRQRRIRSMRARWPGGPAFDTDALVNRDADCLELQSLEGLAKLRLHRSGLLVDLFVVMEARATAGDNADADSHSAFAYYTTVHQTFLVEHTPEQFSLPVAILLHAKAAIDRGDKGFEFEVDRDRYSLMSSLPESAALSTRPEFSLIAPQAQTLAASTDSSSEGTPIQEILRVGTMPSKWLYRHVVVEVQEDDTTFFVPRDGSSALVYLPITRSLLVCKGDFFRLYDASGRSQQFTTETIPPSVLDFGLSSGESSNSALASLCQHIQYLRQAQVSRDEAASSYSADEVDPAASTTIIEEVENEHGRFRAYRDGKVRVVFADRTILQIGRNSELCKFVFPDGSEGRTTLAAAPVRQRMYIHRALEFGDWAFASLDERMERFQLQQRTQEIAMQELHRISVRCGMNNETNLSVSRKKVESDPNDSVRAVPLASTLSPELLNRVRKETLAHIAAVTESLRAANAYVTSDKL